MTLNRPEKHNAFDDVIIAQIRVSEEGQEGLGAFLNKRKPSWLDGAND